MIHRYRIRTGGTPRTYVAAHREPKRKTDEQINRELLEDIAGIQACMMAAEKDGSLYNKLQEMERRALDRYNRFAKGEGDGRGRQEGVSADGSH